LWNLTKGQRPLEPANQSRAVPGTLAHPCARWEPRQCCPLDCPLRGLSAPPVIGNRLGLAFPPPTSLVR
jgi:hypothetical protein